MRGSRSWGMSKVLVVGPDGFRRSMLAEYLRLDSCEVEEVANLKNAIDAVRRQRPDLVIVEDDDPGTGELTFTRDLRSVSEVPLILVSERNAESDRITALELGADDCLTKSVSPKEVAARARAILRRLQPSEAGAGASWRLGDGTLSLDLAAHQTSVDRRHVTLTASEWKVLTCLVAAEGAVLSRDRIMEKCFQYSADVYDRIVDTHVKNIRTKLRNPGWIETVKGFGYRFAGEPDGACPRLP
jgi:DNA-binding response OmpR family regulator